MNWKTAMDAETDPVQKAIFEAEYQKKAALLQRQNAAYKRFCEENNFKTRADRISIAKWDRKQAAAARAAAKKAEKSVANHEDSGTITKTPINGTENRAEKNSEVPDLHHVTRLDVEKYKCVAEDIATDEVIITDERIQHIKDRHPNDYERFSAYIPEAIKNPDYIIEDKPATAMVLKHIEESGEHFRLAIRLATSSDNPDYKNSVLTFLKIREKEWKRLIKNKKILYKAE